MMTTGSVFGNSDISNRPEFAGQDPRVQAQNVLNEVVLKQQEELAELQAKEANRVLLQEAVAKFMAKEITKEELKVITDSLGLK